MRIIKFNELKLKNIDEDSFYKLYLQNLSTDNITDDSFQAPTRQYEIFYLDSDEKKLLLLNTNYIKNHDLSFQELYYDYSIALKVYNLLLDINDGIDAEMYEINELYKDERLEKEKQINLLRQLDNEIFSKALHEYNIIINSEIYHQYQMLLEENELLKYKLNSINNTQKTNLIQKILNKFKQKKLPL